MQIRSVDLLLVLLLLSQNCRVALCQVSELDEGDGVHMMDPDFPEESLPEKPANVVQVVTSPDWVLHMKLS